MSVGSCSPADGTTTPASRGEVRAGLGRDGRAASPCLRNPRRGKAHFRRCEQICRSVLTCDRRGWQANERIRHRNWAKRLKVDAFIVPAPADLAVSKVLAYAVTGGGKNAIVRAFGPRAEAGRSSVGRRKTNRYTAFNRPLDDALVAMLNRGRREGRLVCSVSTFEDRV